MDIDNKSKVIDHPMEELFDIPKGGTEIVNKHKNANLSTSDDVNYDYNDNELEDDETTVYDNKDNDIDNKFQEVYNAAMSAYDMQMDEALIVDGRFKARTSEVAVQFLTTALNAAKEKANLKNNKDKLSVSNKKLNKTVNNNNLIIADRNEILRNMLKKDS